MVREAQEIVELCLKGMLRQIGVELPHWHDVSPLLMEYRERLPQRAREHIERIVEVSGWLRKERECSFYGDIDLIPTEDYIQRDAHRAIADAEWIVTVGAMLIPPLEHT